MFRYPGSLQHLPGWYLLLAHLKQPRGWSSGKDRSARSSPAAQSPSNLVRVSYPWLIFFALKRTLLHDPHQHRCTRKHHSRYTGVSIYRQNKKFCLGGPLHLASTACGLRDTHDLLGHLVFATAFRNWEIVGPGHLAECRVTTWV